MIEVNQSFFFLLNSIDFFILEHQANTNLNERESRYEQQIKEYQTKLDQSNHDLQNIQSELTKLQEEKVYNEKKSNDIINSLKQDHERQYETLKTELTELQDRGLMILNSFFSISVLNRSYTKYGIK
jgi:DNA repair exonuclease SbcCD ATPase subunit